MTELEWVGCAHCAWRPPGRCDEYCWFCAHGPDSRPRVHPKAMSVEYALLGSMGLSARHILRLRKNHGLVHDFVDSQLEEMAGQQND